MDFDSFDDDAPVSDINVTPLVDVMLVLLIVFMITMPVLTHSVQIDLPTSDRSAAARNSKETKPVDIAVNAEGKYAFGAESEQFIDEAALKTELQAVYAKDKDSIIAINADNRVPYEKVARLLEMAQDIGFRKVGFRFKADGGKS